MQIRGANRSMRSRTNALPTLMQQVRNIYARYPGSALYLPGAGIAMGVSARNFVDSAGQVPIALDGFTGLALSDITQIGPEHFNDALLAFSGGASRISPGVYRIYSGDGSFANVLQSSGLSPNSMYRLEFSIDSITALGGGLAVDSQAGFVVGDLTTVGKKTIYFATSGTGLVSIKRFAGVTDIQISGLSLRAVYGLRQTTTANKPQLKTENGLNYWQLNGTSNRFFIPQDVSDAGWICAGVTFGGAAAGLEGVFSTGANASSARGVALARYTAANRLSLITSNGSALTFAHYDHPSSLITGAVHVVEAGWSGSAQFCGVNGALSSQVPRSGSLLPRSQPDTIVGSWGSGFYLAGRLYPMSVMTALPTVSERVILRRLIAVLAGVVL